MPILSRSLKLLQIAACLALTSVSLAAQKHSIATNDPEPIRTRQYHYLEQGSGPALILLHAFPADKRMWSAQLAGLSKQFRVIALDLDGFGEASEWLSCMDFTLSMRDESDYVSSFMQKLKLDKAIIAGLSMGGYVALSFFERHPELVAGLVLSNTQAIADTPEQKAARGKLSRDIHWQEGAKEQFVASFLKKALHEDAAASNKDELAKIVNGQHSFSMSAALLGMAERTDYRDLLTNSKVPVLVIGSTSDQVIPVERSEELAEGAPNSRLNIIENSGHLSNIDQADRWNNAVIEFFTEVRR